MSALNSSKIKNYELTSMSLLKNESRRTIKPMGSKNRINRLIKHWPSLSLLLHSYDCYFRIMLIRIL